MTLSMCSHRLLLKESLTWDDVCELWDGGIYTAEEMERIACLYFEGSELRAVLKVIEKVEKDSSPPRTIKPGPGERLPRPSDRRKKAA